jgi:phosphoglycolate phosphatase
MPRRFDLIVFDWDGTLIDSADAIGTCIQLAARDLGLAAPDAESAKHVIGLGLQDALAHAIPTLDPRDYGRLVERYRHHSLLRDASLPLFAGTREMLERLARGGHALAIATGKSANGLARALATAGLEQTFVATRCADQTAPKPDPAMLEELIDEIDVDRARVVMIGDTTHDLQMAAAAEVAAIAVTYGAHPRIELAKWPAIATVESTSELDAWLAANA